MTRFDIGRTLRKALQLFKSVRNRSKYEAHAKALLYWGMLYGVVPHSERANLSIAINQGNDLVIRGIKGFEHLEVSVEELIGVLKVLISDAFPNNLPEPQSELSAHIIAHTIPITTELAEDIAIRTRAISTDEFIELAKRNHVSRTGSKSKAQSECDYYWHSGMKITDAHKSGD